MPESTRTPSSTARTPGEAAIVESGQNTTPDGAEDGATLGRHPSRVPLVLRVGVVGENRVAGGEAGPDGLAAVARDSLLRIRRAAEEIAAAADGAYAPRPPLLRLISTLSDSTERLVAQEALALGYVLECPLPFDRERIEESFTEPLSRTEFRTLLKHASAVLELDGSDATPADLAAADHAANQIMLAHCDLLISVCNRDEARDETPARLIAQAGQAGIPIIEIEERSPHEVRLLADEDGPPETTLDRLGPVLAPSLLPADSAPEGMRAYFAEPFPGWSLLGGIWPFFHDLLGRSQFRPPRLRAATPEDADRQWQQDWDTQPRLPEPLTRRIDRSVEAHFIWADTLASHYVSLYRSSFILIGILAVLAVLMGVIGDATHWSEHYEWFETFRRLAAIGMLLAIMLLWQLGTRQRWHRRGIDYRFLAEELRQLRYLAPLGRVPAFSHLQAHEAADDPEKTWMGWQARAITRAMGLIDVRMTPHYIDACHALVRDGLIGGQIAYHGVSARRFQQIERRLHRLGFLTFVGTLAVLLISFVVEVPGVLLLEVVLPALGAALGAIRSQAELERLAKRSEAMARYLEQLGAQLDVPVATGSSSGLAYTAELATAALAAEVSDWRVVFQSKPLELPG